MRVISKHIRSLSTGYNVMRYNLETTPGVVGRNDQNIVPARSGLFLQPSEWSTALTTIACAYRLMTFFPSRFTEFPPDVNNAIWGHSPNNWQAALCVIEHFGLRRKTIKLPLVCDRLPLRAPKWFGYDTDPEVEFARLYAHQLVDDMRFELSNMCPSITQFSDVDLGEMADLHDINRVLGFDSIGSPSSQAISWRICERISEILQLFGPSIDIEEDIKNRPNNAQFYPAQEKDMKLAMEFLKKSIPQYDDYLGPEACRLGRIHQLNAVADNVAACRAIECYKQHSNETSKVLQRTLQMLAIRMLIEADLRDQSEARPGNSIPAIRIRTVEMALRDDDQTSMYHFVMEHMYSLILETQDSELMHTSQGRIGKPPTTRVNIGEQKILALASTHINFSILTKANVRNIRLIAEFDEKLSGSSGMNSALRHDRSGGLQWYFYHTRQHGGCPVPLGSLDMMQYICFQSPKISYVARKALELKKKKKRLLVYCEHALTQAVVCALLVHLGVRTLQIRRQHTRFQRDKAHALFTNPKSDVECLITSMAPDNVRVDYYACCSYGIILELPETATTLFQAISRPNSSAEFFWDILVCRGTFDSYQESRLMAEQANILAAGVHIPSEIQGQLRIICAYEILRVCLGQRVNLYPRNGVEWELFDDEPFVREGEFYSALAQLVLNEPSLCEHCTEENLGRISASWKPGMKLTPDHIRERMPILPDGVALRRFNNDEGKSEGDGEGEDTSDGEFFDCMELFE